MSFWLGLLRLGLSIANLALQALERQKQFNAGEESAMNEGLKVLNAINNRTHKIYSQSNLNKRDQLDWMRGKTS